MNHHASPDLGSAERRQANPADSAWPGPAGHHGSLAIRTFSSRLEGCAAASVRRAESPATDPTDNLQDWQEQLGTSNKRTGLASSPRKTSAGLLTAKLRSAATRSSLGACQIEHTDTSRKWSDIKKPAGKHCTADAGLPTARGLASRNAMQDLRASPRTSHPQPDLPPISIETAGQHRT